MNEIADPKVRAVCPHCLALLYNHSCITSKCDRGCKYAENGSSHICDAPTRFNLEHNPVLYWSLMKTYGLYEPEDPSENKKTTKKTEEPEPDLESEDEQGEDEGSDGEQSEGGDSDSEDEQNEDENFVNDGESPDSDDEDEQSEDDD